MADSVRLYMNHHDALIQRKIMNGPNFINDPRKPETVQSSHIELNLTPASAMVPAQPTQEPPFCPHAEHIEQIFRDNGWGVGLINTTPFCRARWAFYMDHINNGRCMYCYREMLRCDAIYHQLMQPGEEDGLWDKLTCNRPVAIVAAVTMAGLLLLARGLTDTVNQKYYEQGGTPPPWFKPRKKP
jgi:hypothetical protein